MHLLVDIKVTLDECLWPSDMSITLKIKTGLPEDGADERRNVWGIIQTICHGVREVVQINPVCIRLYFLKIGFEV